MKNILRTVFLLSSTFLFGQLDFKLLNPKPSAARAIEITFSTPENGFIINNNKELLSTADKGVTWTKKMVLDFMPGSIKFRDSIGLIVGDGRILRSNDYGHSWKRANVQNAFYLNSINFISKDTVYVSSTGNLQKSFDGGKTWNYGGYINSTGAVKTVFTSSKVGIAACLNGRIAKTTDAGATWVVKSVENSSPSDFYSLDFPSPMVGFANRGHGTMLKTTDGGETWNVLPSIYKEIYDIHFFDENVGFAAGFAGAVYKTNDGGTTWIPKSVHDLYTPTHDSDITGLFFFDEDHGFLAGESGRIMSTANGGDFWKRYAATYDDINKMQFVNSDVAYFKTKAGEFFSTNDAGETWLKKTYPPHVNYSQNFQFLNKDLGYSIGGGGNFVGGSVYKTTDGSVTWTLTNNNTILLNEALYSISFLSENVGYVSGGYNYPSLFKTTDGGTTWQKRNNISFSKLQFLSENIGFGIKSGQFWKMYKTTDGGENWNLVFTESSGEVIFDFITDQIGFIKGSNGTFFKTNDGGTTWTESVLPYYGFDKIKFINENVGFVADDHSIYQTKDSGQTWESIFSASENTLRITSLNADQNYLYFAGINGRVYKSSLAFLSAHHFSKTQKTIIYPNPSKDIFKITSTKNISRVNVYDFSGKLLLSKINSGEVNLADYNSGIYFLELIFDDHSKEAQKIIKQ